MDIKQLFEVHTNDCGNPSFVCDYETGELLYMNQAMEKKFQLFTDYTGKKASEVIPQYSHIRGFLKKEEVPEGDMLEDTVYSESLGVKFRSKVTKWNICGRKYLQTKYFLARTDGKQQEAENLFEKAIALCLEILSDATLSSPVNSFLELLGKFYACEQVYICEFDHVNNRLCNRHIWTENGILEDMPLYNDSIKLDQLIHWLESDNSKSIINLDKNHYNFDNYGKDEKILKKNNFENITMSKLWNKDGSLMGILGLNNRADQMYDDRLLQAISHFVMEQFNQKSMVETLEIFNDVDLLTGFYNRRKYAEKLVELENDPPESLGVLFVNMNGLRETNEYLGYEKGDAQIKKTSSLLNEYFYGDFYRLTGDEFIGFIENCEEHIFLDTVDSLQKRLKEHSHEATFSFGHSWEANKYNVTNLIKIADAVMVVNKQSYFSNHLSDMEKISDSLMQDLFKALENDEFLVYLQPQVDLKTEVVVGAEALIRRYDKTSEKMIFPDNFIPIYEENAIIRHVDLFVIDKVCQYLNEWKKYDKDIAISVNLSRVTLMEYGIVQTICDILDKYDIDHKQIIIEVTERIGMVENDVASTLVDEFKEKGFKLSLDDFGCAYSNIVTLATISVDEVKIDKSLVDNVLSNPKNAVIVESMLNMCLNLENTHTLAEGIETKEQADFLRSAKCHLGQGYYFSRPMPKEDFFVKYIALSENVDGK